MMMRKAVDGVVPMVDESNGKEILKIFRNSIVNYHKCKQKGTRKRKTTRQGKNNVKIESFSFLDKYMIYVIHSIFQNCFAVLLRYFSIGCRTKPVKILLLFLPPSIIIIWI
jgi:hypothetical protein